MTTDPNNIPSGYVGHNEAEAFFTARLVEQREKMGADAFFAVFIVEDDAVMCFLGDTASKACEFVAKHDANSANDWTALGYCLAWDDSFGVTLDDDPTPSELLIAVDTKYRPTVVAKS